VLILPLWEDRANSELFILDALFILSVSSIGAAIDKVVTVNNLVYCLEFITALIAKFAGLL
jgi:hypothetical protein